MQQGSSTEEELALLKSNYTDDGLTWDDFGLCSETNITDLENEWFCNSAPKRVKLHSIWVRHPIRQQQGKKSCCFEITLYLLSHFSYSSDAPLNLTYAPVNSTSLL